MELILNLLTRLVNISKLETLEGRHMRLEEMKYVVINGSTVVFRSFM